MIKHAIGGLALAATLSTALSGCLGQSDPVTRNGVNVAESSTSTQATIDAVADQIASNPNLGQVARVDHQANAESVDASIGPNQVIFFGNPRLGTPLMQSRRTVGIDLPQRVQAFTDADGVTRARYNNAAYLRARHGLTGVDEQLATIDNALAGIVENATGSVPRQRPAGAIARGDGLIQRESTVGFDATLDNLRQAIDNNDALILAGELDHDQNAASVGMSLPPTHVFILGNPAAGTPLIAAAPRIALDLPQKFLIFADAGIVKIAYNDPGYLARRHGLTGQDERLDMIRQALGNLASQAAGNS